MAPAAGCRSRRPARLLTAALDGRLADVEFRKDANFGFEVPVSVHGVPEILLDPRRTWDDPAAYDRQAAKLVEMFADNFAQYLASYRRGCESRRHRLNCSFRKSKGARSSGRP